MTDKLKIPHEYLPALRRMREGSIIPSDLAKVDEFIAAAEADQPPLPKGWHLLVGEDIGSARALWHDGNGTLYPAPGAHVWGGVHETAGTLTPLRPTVTEADVEKAARAARAAYFNGPDYWDTTTQGDRDAWMGTVRAALDALDIEAVMP